MSIMTRGIDRRDFLKETAAGLTFALTLAADPRSITGAAAAADSPLATAWVTIATECGRCRRRLDRMGPQ